MGPVCRTFGFICALALTGAGAWLGFLLLMAQPPPSVAMIVGAGMVAPLAGILVAAAFVLLRR
jgi:hypothetical protein